jgi:eukaryotic-like serine/threonine-protein kinase
MFPESSSKPAEDLFEPANILQTQRTVQDPSLPRSSRPRLDGEDGSRGGSEAATASSSSLVTTQSLYSVASTEKPYAAGGMGTILLAQDETLGRTVVLKVLLEKLQKNRELSDRFRREASITAQLQHPGIPPVYGAGTLSDMRPFFSMRLVQGQTLAQLLCESVDHLKDRPRFLTIFEQVCQTVAFAHARGVIHRDLKPENIVVGDYGSVYVMDWGIARFLRMAGERGAGVDVTPPFSLDTQDTIVLTGRTGDYAMAEDGSSITIPGDLLGTPQYMSPEQARGDSDQDERTDVFSLGVILFEILTGRPLRPVTTVQRESLEVFAAAHHLTALARLDAARADAPMVNLVKRCLDLDRDRRPRNASEVAAEVTSYLLHVLRRPERDLARFFELSLDLFCLAGLDGFFKQINQNFTRVLGYSTEELLAKPFIDLVHPDDCEQTRLQVVKLSQGLPVVRFENRYRDRSGNYKWFEWTAKAVPEEGIIFATARDITERKHLEQRLAAIVESSPMAMVMTDRAGRIVQLNREAEKLFGFQREELAGQMVEMLIPERFRQGHLAHRERFLMNPSMRPGSGRELWGLRKDGTEFPIELGLSPLETEEGIFVVSVIADITERKRQTQWFQAIVECFPTGMVMFDSAGTICLVSKETERLFGYSRGELIGQVAEILIPERLRVGHRELRASFFASASKHRTGETREIVGKRKDGAEFPIQLGCNPLGGGGVLLISEIPDLTTGNQAPQPPDA